MRIRHMHERLWLLRLILVLSFFRDSFLARWFSVVGEFLVASRRTAATGLVFYEIERQFPVAEGDLVSHQFGLFSCMDRMAEFAVLPPSCFVHMEVMQIPVAVPETRRVGRRGIFKQITVMAGEAQLIFGFAVGKVVLGRIRLVQQLCVRRAVRIVTRAAQPALHRTVKNGLRFLDQALVAVETELLDGCRQELRLVARMRDVAGGAAPLRLKRLVDRPRVFQFLLDLGMALIAKPGARRAQEFSHGRAMGIMTGRASALQGRVREFFLERIPHLIVTGKAQFRALFREQALGIRFMRTMAQYTIARCRGTMDELMIRDIGVA